MFSLIYVFVQIPSSRDDDLIDTLFDLAPDKISSVEKTLLNFINSHLNYYDIHIQEIDMQYFQDGLNLLYLIAHLEKYFLVLNKYYHKKPITREQSYANVQLAFELIYQGKR
jgi:parvin